MSEIELIERLRRSTEEHARRRPTPTSEGVTCEYSLRSPPRADYCREIYCGHRCRFSDQPREDRSCHRSNIPHQCECGVEWRGAR